MASLYTNSKHALNQPITQKMAVAKQKISPVWQWRLFIGLLILNDIVMIGAALRLAYTVRFTMNIPIFELLVRPSFQFYQIFILFVIPIWLFIFGIMGLYNRERLLGGTREYSTLFNATLIGLVLVMAAGFFFPDLVYSRGWVLTSWALAFFFTAIGRFLLRRVIYYLRNHGYMLSNAIIIGANDEGRMLAEQLLQWKTSGLNILGFVDKKIKPGLLVMNGLHCLGDMEHLDDVIAQYGVEEIILASSAISSRDRMVEIIKRFAFSKDLRVRFSSGLYEIITTGVSVNPIAYVPLMGVNPVRMSGMDMFLKMAMDYTIGLIALIVSLPILAVLYVAVKLDSPGPFIHRRRVVGLNGTQFDAFKVRTMHVNGNEILAAQPDLLAELQREHKLKNDPRITRVGKWLRKLSLDELPQVMNVLRGEMSIVGPRMITPEEIEKYSQWDVNLLTVKPGITGLWQVSGRSDVSYEDRVRLDMYYIRNWTIWVDIQLILQTIPAVLKSRGAY